MTYEQQLSEQWIAAKADAEHHEFCLSVAEANSAPEWVVYHQRCAKEKRAEMARILERLPAPVESEKEAA
jgi:hypothetical protein